MSLQDESVSVRRDVLFGGCASGSYVVLISVRSPFRMTSPFIVQTKTPAGDGGSGSAKHSIIVVLPSLMLLGLMVRPTS